MMTNINIPLINWRRHQRKGKQTDGRYSRFMTQQEAADHFKVCLRTYINWELGNTKCPGYITGNLI